MKFFTTLLALLAAQFVIVTANLLPFHRGACKSTTTITAGERGGIKISTATKTATVASVKTITRKGTTITSTVSTTITTTTFLRCLAKPTSFTASPLPIKPSAHSEHERSSSLELFEEDTPAEESLHPKRYIEDAKSCSPVTIYQPALPFRPCTRVVHGFGTTVFTTKTRTKTTTRTSVIARHPTTLTVTQTFVLPIPSTKPGLNYYQYINNYSYPDASTGMGTTDGFGGGGYTTSDWRGNLSYYTSGLTQNVNFQSQNYPSYSSILCQLPGQSAPSDCSQWTVVFQGFLHAKAAGNYTVNPVLIDNELLTFGGEKAYRDFTDENVDGVIGIVSTAPKPLSAQFTLGRGEFMPITLIWANGKGPASLSLSIDGPNGTSYPADLDLFLPPCPGSRFIP